MTEVFIHFIFFHFQEETAYYNIIIYYNMPSLLGNDFFLLSFMNV